MIQRHVYKDITWVDLEAPTGEDVRTILAEFNINNLIGEELLSPTLRSKADVYTNFIYLIIHLPSSKDSSGIQEIDFIIGEHFIITTHYEDSDPLLEFSRTFEIESILNRSNIGTHAGYIFYYMMRLIYHSLIDKLDCVEEDIIGVEKKIFAGHERAMVTELSKQSRILLTFKNATDNHQTVLESLEEGGKKLFGEDFMYYIRNIQGECRRVRNAISTKRSYISELRETNDSLLTSKQNEIMKIFTVLAFVTFPIGIVIDILGIPSEHNPVLGNTNDFWIIVGITMGILLIMIGFFKKKDWI